MPASQKAIDLIKESEGFYADAYPDPVGIPTIGWGTIRYPNGKKVTMGDRISKSEAEAFLKFECDEVGNGILAETRGIALNQNQFDALVSFCYNLGVGALHESTLLKKLKAGETAAAAAEFPRWNKAVKDGAKIELAGLTTRRAKERQLFETPSTIAASGEAETTPRERVVAIKGFRSDTDNLVAGYDEQGRALELVQLDGDTPEAFRALLGIYPRLKTVSIAGPGDPLPAIERVRISGRAEPPAGSGAAPPLNRKLLLLGSEDAGAGNSDVRTLQLRLKDLGYYKAEPNGIFDRTTDAAVKEFQAITFGVSEADGRVGPVTWAKLWGAEKPSVPTPGTPTPGKNYLMLTKTRELFPYGCTKLQLTYYKNGQAVDSIYTCSGQGRKQKFRTGVESPAMSMEPLPEGKWSLSDMMWVAGRDNYTSGVWNDGLGPVKIFMDYLGPARTARSAIEIHIDWNRAEAPGTAGCIGVQSVADFKVLAGWLRDTDPKHIYVDWGLGTCPAP